MPSFDWYQATLTDQQPEEVLAVLKEFFRERTSKGGACSMGTKRPLI